MISVGKRRTTKLVHSKWSGFDLDFSYFSQFPQVWVKIKAWLMKIGQVHDMFSRILQTRIYDFFLFTKYYVIFVLICSKLRKKGLFLTDKEFAFFFNWETLVKKFVFGKFVKTCRELDNSLDLALRNVIQYIESGSNSLFAYKVGHVRIISILKYICNFIKSTGKSFSEALTYFCIN